MIDMHLNRTIPVPLHSQVYQQLSDAIRDGRMKAGDALPPEPALARRLVIARGTLRQAVDQLVREGLLRRERGRGTFVEAVASHATAGPALTRQTALTDTEQPRTFRVVRHHSRVAPPRIREALALGPGARVWEIERVRLVHGDPVALETIYLPEERLPGFSPDAIEERSLYEVIEADWGLTVSGADMTARAVLLDDEPARLLGLVAGSPAFHVERTTEADGLIVELRSMLLPGHHRVRLQMSREHLLPD